jgi:preprotein translocase subunit SecE
LRFAAASAISRALPDILKSRSHVAKTTPIEFIRQVQAETKKVVWPDRRQTVMTAVMVIIMTSLLALFFLGVDSIFDAIVNALLSLAA